LRKYILKKLFAKDVEIEDKKSEKKKNNKKGANNNYDEIIRTNILKKAASEIDTT